MKVSYFHSTVSPVFRVPSAPEGKKNIHFAAKQVEFSEIIQAVKARKFESKIGSIMHNYKALKRTALPCFTPSGTFRLRQDNDLLVYSGILCLDYDNVGYLYELKQKAQDDPHTLAAFYSPSYKGLKVFVQVSTPADCHLMAYQAVAAHYDEVLGAEHDRKCKNISRLCFIGSDADVVYNPTANYFVPERTTTNDVPRVAPDIEMLASNSNSVFGWLYNFTLKKAIGYFDGNRNNFLFAFACNCNRYGIHIDRAIEFASIVWNQNQTGISWDEVTKTVRSAYNYQAEHAKFTMPQFEKIY